MPDRECVPGQSVDAGCPVFVLNPLGELPLTRRECEVLWHAACGRTAAETAGVLFLAERTVKVYLGRARLKLRARNTTQAVAVAIARRLIGVDAFLRH